MIPVGFIIVMIALPVYALWRTGKDRPLRHPYLFSVGSFLCCGGAMLQELYTIKRRLTAGDIGGIEDTIDAVLLICIVVLVIAVILNLLSLGLAHESAKEQNHDRPLPDER